MKVLKREWVENKKSEEEPVTTFPFIMYLVKVNKTKCDHHNIILSFKNIRTPLKSLSEVVDNMMITENVYKLNPE